MNMMTNVFEKLIDFTRTSAGGYYGPDGLFRMTPASKNLLTYTQEFDNAAWAKTAATALPFDPAMVSLGSEVVANGDFASAASWTAPAAGASITGGALTFDGVTAMTSGSVTVNSVVTPIVIGRWYAVTFTIIGGTTNPVSVNLGGTIGTARSAAGTYTEYLFAIATTAVDVSTRGATGIRTGSIDNISVKEVIGGLITAPDGTLTADAFVASAGVNLTPRITNPSPTTTTNAVYTVSCFARPGTHPFIQLHINAQIADWCNFTLIGSGSVQNNGAAVGSVTYDSVSGWYRISMTYTAASTAQNPFIMLAASASASRAQTWSPAGTESIYLWGAQLELGSTATSYARNFGGLFPPRFDYDPVTKAPRGLLVEEQRTNLLLRSEEFESASWFKSRATVTANAAVSPDGTADADKIVEDTTNNTHRVYQQAAKAASSLTRTFSVYLKAAERTLARIRVTDNSETVSANAEVDLSAGTIGAANIGGGSTITAASSAIFPAGNGWYRCVITATFDATITSPGAFIQLRDAVGGSTYAGDGTSGIFAWGAQWEDGAFPTSYIPTAASQVTRTADIATITGANFSNWYSRSEGTFVVEASLAVAGYDCYLVTAFGAAGIGIRRFSSNAVVGYNRVGGINDVNGVGSFTSGTLKVAYAVKSGDQAASLNGAAPATNAITFTQAQTQLNIGFLGGGGTAYLNGHIRSIKYWPTRLSNSQLQTLSA